jgi:hypothetical protein
MSGFAILDTPMAYDALHAFHKQDVFGFQGAHGQKYRTALVFTCLLVVKNITLIAAK